ncbi:TonB-dependent receptor [Sphingomonas sp. DBB INV C78]|uniref:TonB-dependent receptor n=1 Tax=Sphingomonas sp. DBB INV C78 TaxID=3349434 RepID=UPI0036D29E2E
MRMGQACCASLALLAPDLAEAESAAQPPLADIIVTGERVSRTIAETASSVAVVTGEDIDAMAAPDRIDQLLARIPNLQQGSGTEGVAIRGQDSTGVLRELSAFLGGTRPRVTLQVDGRALGYYEYVFGANSIWDADQVEVYRSPQTTTQGRNSIAGAIFINTADPTYRWEGRARALAGNYGTLQGSAVVSGPIVADELAIRLSGDIRRARNSSEMADAIVGASLDHDDAGIGRVKLLAEPSALPGLRIQAFYVHAESQAPQFEGVTAPFRDREMPAPERTNGVYRIRSDSLTGLIDYRLAAGLTSRATLSWGDVLSKRFGLPGLGRTQVDSQDFSAEGVLDWRPDDAPVEATGGVHWLNVRQRQSIDVTGLGLGLGDFTDRQTSLGFFGEASWRPASAIKIIAGLRYQRDRQDRDGQLRAPGSPVLLDYDRTFSAWLPKISIAWDVMDGETIGIMAQRAYNPGGTTINLRTAAQDEFVAERLWNYEFFARGSFDGGRGTITANIFYNDIRDAQRTQNVRFVPPDNIPIITQETANAPRAESYGAELELNWRAARRFSIGAGVGLLQTRIKQTQLPDDPILGREFQRAPNFTAAASAEWWPMDGLSLSTQARLNSGYFSDDANTTARHIAGATIVDARAAYSWGRITLFGYARNLFDNFYLTYLFTPSFGTAGDPREVGIGLEARF